MKTPSLIIVTALAAALQFAPVAQAGDREGRGGGWRGRHAVMANLTPEERTKLRAAHQKVMADPVVQAAKDRVRQAAKDFRDLKRSKMLQADPSLQPILDKLPQRGGGKDNGES